MQRNTELARELLEIIVIEDGGGGGLHREEIHAVMSERYPDHESGYEYVEYHLRLLVSGGFILLTEDDAGNRHMDNFEMVWAGHDLLESEVGVSDSKALGKKGFFS